MLPAPEFSVYRFQLRDHPLFRRNPPDDKWSGRELPTEVGEAQECEGVRFSLALSFPVSSSMPPELDQPRLTRV